MENQSNDRKLFSYKESSRYLGIPETTLRYWVSKCRLVPVRMGLTSYFDKDTLDSIRCSVEDAEHARTTLELLTDEMREAAEKVRKERLFLRYKEVCMSAVKPELLCMVVDILRLNGELTERESFIIKEFLLGSSREDICSKYGLTWTRMSQIILRGIASAKKLRMMENFRKKCDELEEQNARLLSKIEVLEKENADMKNGLIDMSSILPSDEMSADEFEKIDELCRVLQTPLHECGFSKRTDSAVKRIEYCGWGHTGEFENCHILADLVSMQSRSFREYRNVGKKTVMEVEDYLDSCGLEWGMDVASLFKKRARYLNIVKK